MPFLGVQGFMVTKYATTHGVETRREGPGRQLHARHGARRSALAAANGRYPANTLAGKQVTDKYLCQLGIASKGGVPMPNIPQMASVWSELGGAWVKATKGSGSTKAAKAFTVAARNIANKIG